MVSYTNDNMKNGREDLYIIATKALGKCICTMYKELMFDFACPTEFEMEAYLRIALGLYNDIPELIYE